MSWLGSWWQKGGVEQQQQPRRGRRRGADDMDDLEDSTSSSSTSTDGSSTSYSSDSTSDSSVSSTSSSGRGRRHRRHQRGDGAAQAHRHDGRNDERGRRTREMGRAAMAVVGKAGKALTHAVAETVAAHKAKRARQAPPAPPQFADPTSPAARLCAYVHERCRADFSVAAQRELYQLFQAIGDTAVDASRVYIAGGEPRVLHVPLTVKCPGRAGPHQQVWTLPLRLEVPATYRCDEQAASGEPAVLVVNLQAEELRRCLNPQTPFVDASTGTVRVPQGSSTLTAWSRDVEAAFRRSPVLQAPVTVPHQQAGDSAATATAAAPLTPSVGHNGEISPLGFDRPPVGTPSTAVSGFSPPDAAAVTSAIQRAAHRLFDVPVASVRAASDAGSGASLLLPVFHAGRRENIPVVVEADPTSRVALVRVRVTPPHGFVVYCGDGAPCDAEGYVTEIDRLAHTFTRSVEAALANRQQLEDAVAAVLITVQKALGGNPAFPYVDAAAAAAAPPAASPLASPGWQPPSKTHAASSVSTASAPPAEPYPAATSLPHPAPPGSTGSGSMSKSSAPLPPARVSGAPRDDSDDDELPVDVERVSAPHSRTGADADEGASPLSPPEPAASPAAPISAAASRPPQQQDAEADACCVVCLDGERAFACVPCGHHVLCGQCVERFPPGSKCPNCRGDIQCTIRIFR